MYVRLDTNFIKSKDMNVDHIIDNFDEMVMGMYCKEFQFMLRTEYNQQESLIECEYCFSVIA